MRNLVWILIFLLFILHQDNWLWDNGTLVFGVFPMGLAYHVGVSLAASVLWYLATVYCWPAGLDEVEPESPEARSQP